jgi:hypothetical protein
VKVTVPVAPLGDTVAVYVTRSHPEGVSEDATLVVVAVGAHPGAVGIWSQMLGCGGGRGSPPLLQSPEHGCTPPPSPVELDAVSDRLHEESEQEFVPFCLSFETFCVPVQVPPPITSQLRNSSSS